jgi:sugar lactone lactonase YvrE
MKTLLVVSLFVQLFLTHAFSQSPSEMKAAGEAERAAVKAYQAKDFTGFLAQMETANTNRPNHPRLIYNLASANVVNGNADQALALLERLGNMGLAFAIEKDDDFKDISATERFKKVVAKFAENRKPINASQKALTASDKELIVEGVAFDQKTENVYLASVHQRKIVKIDKNGVATDFSNPADGLWGVYGIRVDAERGWLWVSSLASIANRGLLESDKNKSGIFRYNLKTGKLLKKYIVPGEERHALGDLIIARDGRIFSTDSAAATIYSIDPKTDEFQVFLKSDMLASPEGLTLDGTGNMFVADYSKGIFRINTHTKQITQLIPASDITLLGIDGLYFYKGNLIAIQNGINPHRVVHFTLDGDKVTKYLTLEANHADFDEPTLAALVGDKFYFNANSQFGHFNAKGVLATDKLHSPVILNVDLKKALAK